MKEEDWEQLVEADDTPLERARLFARLLKGKIPLTTIAAKFGRVPRTIADRARVAESRRLSGEVKGMWDLGRISFEVVRSLLGKAHKGMSVKDQIEFAREAETKRELMRGQEHRPRVLRTEVAVVQARQRGRATPRPRHVKELVPVLPVAITPTIEPVVVEDPPVLGCITPAQIASLIALAKTINVDLVPHLVPMNGHRLTISEMRLLWLLRHYHRGVRAKALELLPPPKTGNEVRAALVTASILEKRNRPHYQVVPLELITAIDRIMASRRSNREKRLMIAQLVANQGKWSKARADKDGERDNHKEEPRRTPRTQKGGKNRAKYKGAL